jgi:hypothetical protein
LLYLHNTDLRATHLIGAKERLHEKTAYYGSVRELHAELAFMRDALSQSDARCCRLEAKRKDREEVRLLYSFLSFPLVSCVCFVLSS